jgi:plasmid stabilization system protein ParE
MRIVFLPSAQHDLEWFRTYYQRVFPEGAAGARAQYKRALASLKENPRIGHPTEDAGNRALPVPRTPFSFICRIAHGRIEVIHVRDGRGEN